MLPAAARSLVQVTGPGLPRVRLPRVRLPHRPGHRQPGRRQAQFLHATWLIGGRDADGRHGAHPFDSPTRSWPRLAHLLPPRRRRGLGLPRRRPPTCPRRQYGGARRLLMAEGSQVSAPSRCSCRTRTTARARRASFSAWPAPGALGGAGGAAPTSCGTEGGCGLRCLQRRPAWWGTLSSLRGAAAAPPMEPSELRDAIVNALDSFPGREGRPISGQAGDGLAYGLRLAFRGGLITVGRAGGGECEYGAAYRALLPVRALS